MLQWILCSLFLGAEMLICTAILIPMPARYRKALLKRIENVWEKYPRARIVTKTFLSVIVLFFVDSIRILYLMSAVVIPVDNLASPAKPEELRIKLYAAQRNAFICGFAIFLYVMLQRFEGLVSDLAKLEKQHAERSGKYDYNQEQIEKLMQERQALIARAREVGVNPDVYLEDNVVVKSPVSSSISKKTIVDSPIPVQRQKVL